MRRVIALELVGLKKLGCDLYDENGKIIYQKETEFTPEIFMILNHTKIFKRDEEQLIIKEPKEPLVKKKRSQTSEKSDSSVTQKKRRLLKEDDDEEKKSSPSQHRKNFNELYSSSLVKKTGNFEPLETEVIIGKRTSEIQEQLRQQALLNKQKEASRNIKISEPLNREDIAEYKSVVDEKSKKILLKGVKEVLYSAFNSAPMGLESCFTVTNTILNEVYTKLSSVNRIDELRIHDYYTFSHSLNVAMLSAIIGRELGFNENKVKDLTFCAFLHDVGKMRIPKEVLYKPERLEPKEMQLVKKHSELGFEFIINKLGLPEQLARPALEHHERWEGQGYPQGLKGNQISKFAQIVAIADVYDALVSNKVYRGSVKSIDAMKIMLTEESRSFNPEILNKFIYMSAINTKNMI